MLGQVVRNCLQKKSFGARLVGRQQQGGAGVYAIVQTGGRQLKVAPGETVTVDGTAGDAGQEVTFDQVLLVEKDGGEVRVGSPYVADARVVGVVDGPAQGPKIRVFKKKRRKGMRRTKGHRAQLTRVLIRNIVI